MTKLELKMTKQQSMAKKYITYKPLIINEKN